MIRKNSLGVNVAFAFLEDQHYLKYASIGPWNLKGETSLGSQYWYRLIINILLNIQYPFDREKERKWLKCFCVSVLPQRKSIDTVCLQKMHMNYLN